MSGVLNLLRAFSFYSDSRVSDILIDELGDPDMSVQNTAVHMVEHSVAGIEPKFMAWNKKYQKISEAKGTLTQSDPRKTVDELIADLKRKESNYDAAAGLAHSRDPRGIKTLVEFVQSTDDLHCRQQAIEGFGSANDPEATDALLKLLTDPNENVRTCAVYALSRTNDSRVSSALQEALKDPEIAVRRVALSELVRLEDPHGIEVLFNDYKIAVADNKVLLAKMLYKVSGLRTFGVMLEMLQDKDERVRSSVFGGFQFIRDTRAVEPFLTCLKQAAPVERSRIPTGLAHYLKDPRVFDALLELTKDSDPNVRGQVTLHLSRQEWFSDSRLRDRYLDLLADKESRVARNAAAGLAGYNEPRVVEALLVAVKGDDYALKSKALRTLESLLPRADESFKELIRLALAENTKKESLPRQKPRPSVPKEDGF